MYGEHDDKKGCKTHNYKENKNLTCCICSSTKISLFKLGKTSLLLLLSRSVTHIAKKLVMMLSVLNKSRDVNKIKNKNPHLPQQL